MRSPETGSAAPFVLLVTVVILAAAGLVIDGGYALAERRKTTHQAEQAARIGADAIDHASLRDGGPVAVDAHRARTAIASYLSAVGVADHTVRIDGAMVTVRIDKEVPTLILSIVGVNSFSASATGTAVSIDDTTVIGGMAP